MKLKATLAICATTALLAGCGGGSDGTKSGGGGDSEYVDSGTFTMSVAGDPGKLDPQSSASSQLFAVNQIAFATVRVCGASLILSRLFGFESRIGAR